MIKTWQKVIFGVLVFLAFWFYSSQSLDPDLGWRIRIGELILEHGQPVRSDPFSFTMPGHVWVDHEWLPNAFLAFMQNHGLWDLVVLLFTVLGFIPFAVWIWRAETSWELVTVLLIAVLALGYLGVRLHLITFLLLFVLWEILQHRKYIFLLPVLFLAWANLHPGVIIGLVWFAVFLATQKRTPPLKYLGIFLVSAGATLLTPFGHELYQEIFRILVSPAVARYINEWQPLFVYLPLPRSLFPAILFWLALTVLLGALVFFLVRYRRRYAPDLYFAGIISLVGYLKIIKLGLPFFLLATPLLVQGLRLAREEIREARRTFPFTARERKFFWGLKFGTWLFLLGFAGWLLFLYQANAYPVKAVKRLRQLNEQGLVGRPINDYGWGGYLLWEAPEIKVFIDGRMAHWRDEQGYAAMDDYIKVFYPEDRDDWQWQEVFERNQITSLFFPNPHCETRRKSYPNKIVEMLKNRSQYVKKLSAQATTSCDLKAELAKRGWEIAYQDELALIMICRKCHKL